MRLPLPLCVGRNSASREGVRRDMHAGYRGRLDASRKEAAPADARRDLFEGMLQVAETGHGPDKQIPSIGCSIKWRAE